MSASDAAEEELSNESENIKIGSRIWKKGDKVYTTGAGVVEKAKMVETFSDAWRTARAEGEKMGRGANKKVRVKWTNLLDSS